MSLRLALAAALGLICVGSVKADEVVLTKGEQSVVARVGEHVVTAFHFGKKYAKPYFLPITAPGALAALEANLNQELPEGSLGRQVIVCSESAEIRNDKQAVATARQGDVLTVEGVSKTKGTFLKIAGKGGWIRLADVAPLAGTVTRLVDDNPSNTRDRNAPGYYDHPHHKGLWISVDELNHVQHWAEKARIENQSVEIVAEQGSPATLKYINHWQGADGTAAVIETTTVHIHPNRLLSFEVQFTAAENEATFRDTKEGMFAIRLPNSMREFTSNGPVTGADGGQTTKELWGKPNPWIDYCGSIDGRLFGVTIMDHPGNPRPSRFHVRDYGLFALNPFGQKAYTNGMLEEAPLTLKPDESSTFRYALYTHDGTADEGKVAEAYGKFIGK